MYNIDKTKHYTLLVWWQQPAGLSYFAIPDHVLTGSDRALLEDAHGRFLNGPLQERGDESHLGLWFAWATVSEKLDSNESVQLLKRGQVRRGWIGMFCHYEICASDVADVRTTRVIQCGIHTAP